MTGFIPTCIWEFKKGYMEEKNEIYGRKVNISDRRIYKGADNSS